MHGVGTTGRGTTRVLLIEEHPVVRRGLSELIEAAADLSVVATVASAAEALPLLAAADVVLIDVQQHRGSGITGCRAIRSRRPDLPCVLLTGGDDEGLRAALLAGAVGHLPKQVGGSGLVDGLRAAASGWMRLDPSTTTPLLARLRTDWPGRPGGVLDEREQQVLDLIGIGCTDAAIAEKLDLPEADIARQVADLVVRLGAPANGPHALAGAVPDPAPATP